VLSLRTWGLLLSPCHSRPSVTFSTPVHASRLPSRETHNASQGHTLFCRPNTPQKQKLISRAPVIRLLDIDASRRSAGDRAILGESCQPSGGGREPNSAAIRYTQSVYCRRSGSKSRGPEPAAGGRCSSAACPLGAYGKRSRSGIADSYSQ
jgi:hypothetical protein